MWPLHRETSLLPVMPYLLLKLCDADPPEAFLWLHELHRVTLKQKGLIVHVIKHMHGPFEGLGLDGCTHTLAQRNIPCLTQGCQCFLD